MKQIFSIKSLTYLVLFTILIFLGLFLFNLDKDRRKINMSADSIHIMLNNTKWTSDNIELTIKYDGDASKHIDSYSIDGGDTWTKSNMFILDNNKKLNIMVKDILGRLYSINYNVSNIDKEGPVIKKIKKLKIKKGSTFNIKKYFKIFDNESGLKEIKITPKKINTKKIGLKKIKIVAVDNLGNKTIKKFKFKIV